MLIFAHRGLPEEYPENTLISLTKAIEAGFSLEIDVHKTKDGKLVIIHDLNVKRLTGVNKNITDMTYEEIKALDYGKHKGESFANTKLPLFEEVIAMFKKKAAPNTQVAIHIKNENEESILKDIVNVFAEHKLHDRWFVFDLTIEGAKKLKAMDQNIRIAMSVAEEKYANTIYALDEVLDLPSTDAIWADEWVYGLYSECFFNKINAAGKPAYVISPELHKDHNHCLYPKREPECWKRLKSWNVEGVCTDYPKEFQQYL